MSSPPRTTLPGPASIPPEGDDSAEELSLDSADFERVTLVDIPHIATYGSYELLGRIAFGGMAEIFLARERGMEDTARMMVVKRVLPHVAEDRHFVDMFRDEARLAMQLNHPNICHVYTYGEVEDTHYLAMEWINGQPLSKIIRRARKHGGIPLPYVLKIVSVVAEALDYAHRAGDAKGEPLGIVHRDVSPQNIMVSYDGVVKLLDFGIAKATSHSTRTEAGIIKGKFAYMSPQQCVGEPIDARADIFALGICLFEAVAGKNPFRRKTEFETMTKIVGDPTPDLRERRPEAPDALVEIVEQALMKQPERRFQTAAEMQLALETVLPTLGTPVNSARLGDYVSTLFAEEVRDGPSLDTKLKEPPRTPPTSSPSSEQSVEEELPPPPPGATEVNPPVSDEMAQQVVPGKRGCGAFAIVAALFLLVGLGSAGALAAWAVFGGGFGGDGFGEGDFVADLLGESPIESPTVDVPPPTPPGVPDPPTPDPPTPDPPTPSVATGTVYVESVPPGADIEIEGRGHAGTSPLEIGMMPPGTYSVTLSLEGHEDWTREITVAEGERATVTAELARVRVARRSGGRGRSAEPPGRLSLNTRPWSKVYLGRRLLGTTPLGSVDVPSGNLRLRLVDRDGREHRRSVNVPPNQAVTQSFDLRD